MKTAMWARKGSRIADEWVGPIALGLLAYIGQIKSNPALSWIPGDLTVWVSALVFVSAVASRVERGRASKALLAPFVLMAFLLMGLFQADFQGYGLTKIVTLFTVTFLCMLAPFYLLRSLGQQKVFLLALAMLGTLVSVATLIRPDRPASYSVEIMFPGTDTIGTARVAATALIVLALLALSKYKTRTTLLGLLAVAVVPLIVLLATQSRGPLLGTVIGISAALLTAAAFRRIRVRAIIGVSIAIAALAAYAIVGGDRLARLFDGSLDNSASARLDYWGGAFSHIQTVPWGIGWGNFANLPGIEAGANLYPHNLVLGISLEGGWLAGLAVCVYLSWALIASSRNSLDVPSAIVFALLVFSVLNALVSGDINSNRLMWMLISSALAVYFQRKARVNATEANSRGLRGLFLRRTRSDPGSNV